MTIFEYVNDYYKGKDTWFIEECSKYEQQRRIMEVLEIKAYLSGKHAILNLPTETYNGKDYNPKKIIVQMAKTLLNFGSSYLLKNPVTLAGDEAIIEVFRQIYRNGEFAKVDFNILDKVIKYGSCAEYIYTVNGVIKSKIIDPADAFPVFDPESADMIGFVEHYVIDSVSYYNVYYPNYIEKWNNNGGRLYLAGRYASTGLPVYYYNQNEEDETQGRSELLDYISILDNLELILSKFTDTFHKYHSPIAVAIGQQLVGSEISKNVVGFGINLDENSDFKLVSPTLDANSFQIIFKTLKQLLLDISCTPAVSMNNTDISNLSEVSIRLLFSLADIKAGLNEQFLRSGFRQRFLKIARMIDVDDIPDVVFTYNRPTNQSDVIADLRTLREIGGLSQRTLLENNPFVNDVNAEIARLQEDNTTIS